MRDVLEMPRLGLAGVTAAATLVGLVAGWGISALTRDDPVSVAGDTPEFVLPEELVRVPDEEMDYAAMLEVLTAAGMRIVPESLLKRLDSPAVGSDGRLSDALIDALLLSDEETDLLNRAIAEAEIRLREIELDRLRVAERSADRLEIHLEAFREEGVGIERMLRDRIAAAIGQIDGELFWNLMTRDSEGPGFDYWQGFGREPRAAIFERRIIDEDDLTETVEIRFFCGPLVSGGSGNGSAMSEDSAGILRLRVGEGSPPPSGAWAILAGRYAYLDEFLPPEWEVYFPRQ